MLVLKDRVQLFGRRLGRYARPKAYEDAIHEKVRRGDEWKPHVGGEKAKIRDGHRGRDDTDDCRRVLVERDDFADHVRRRAELATPERLGEEDSARPTGHELLSCEIAPDEWMRARKAEKRIVDHRAVEV